MYLVDLVVMIHVTKAIWYMPATIQSGRIVLAVGILTLAIVTSNGTKCFN